METLSPLVANLESLIMAVMAVITTVTGIIAKIQADKAKAAGARADGAEQEVEQVQAFFDPEDTRVMTPPAGTPARSWKMSASVKGFVLAGHSAEEQADILRQIDAAEQAGYVDYRISFPSGYYNISYGQIAGGARY